MSYRKNTNFAPKTVYKKQQLAQMNRAVQQVAGRGKTVRLGNNAMIMNVPNYQPALRRATPQEVNYVDLAGTQNMHTTGSLQLLATIPQGASVSQRIGKRAYYKSLMIRAFITAGTTNTVNTPVLMIVYDKRPTGALPAITDIIQTVTPNSMMNDNNTGRFEVIRRKQFEQAGNSTTPQTGQERIIYEDFVRMNKRPITFESAGTGSIGDIDSGALYLIMFSTNPTGTTASQCEFNIRTRFTEQ